MSSVTQRIKEVKQPRGGYLKVSTFDIEERQDNKLLNDEENVHASIIGMVVDYMTRMMMGTTKKDAFKISIMGAMVAEKLGNNGAMEEIESYIEVINGLDDKSITNACKAVTFDVWYRNPPAAGMSKKASDINPDKKTIHNIKTLIERCVNFWEDYGPIEVDGFTFENGGYTDIVTSGDGDFLTYDTLWDFKVSKQEPKSDHTLQILMYYIMGKHTKKEEFENIKKIGIYNPRLNKVYLKNVNEIPKELIDEISTNVIGYENTNIKESKEEKTNINDKKYEMSEIMKMFGCTRYKVMKMYAERGLPLKKEKNKYYLKESELNQWIEQQKELQRQRTIAAIIVGIAFIIISYLLIKKFM